MDPAVGLSAIEGGDYPLDLPPVAEGQHIAGVAAVAGAGRGDQHRLAPEIVDELRCVGQRQAAMDVGEVHARALSRAAV